MTNILDALRSTSAFSGGNATFVEDLYESYLKDPESEISKRLKQYGGVQIRADLELNTGVRYQNLD